MGCAAGSGVEEAQEAGSAEEETKGSHPPAAGWALLCSGSAEQPAKIVQNIASKSTVAILFFMNIKSFPKSSVNQSYHSP